MIFDWKIFLVLVISLLASLAVFYTLVWRTTVARRRVTLADWARENGFIVRDGGPIMPPLNALIALQPRTGFVFRQKPRFGGMSILQMTTDVPERSPHTWHLMVCPIPSPWPPAGLRPTHHPLSLLDIFSLSSFPTMTSRERFTIFSVESAAAQALAKSSAAALLPPDVGMLLYGPWIVLDFSERPFDDIEFDRMLAVARQVIAHLPNVSAA
jgi:hypothetical protein